MFKIDELTMLEKLLVVKEMIREGELYYGENKERVREAVQMLGGKVLIK